MEQVSGSVLEWSGRKGVEAEGLWCVRWQPLRIGGATADQVLNVRRDSWPVKDLSSAA